MVVEVTGDDIQIKGEWFHPMRGSTSKREALKAAEALRKRWGVGARVLYRKRGIMRLIGPLRGKHRWVPFQGYVAFKGE